MEAEILLSEAVGLLKQAAPLVPVDLALRIKALLERVEQMNQPQSYFR